MGCPGRWAQLGLWGQVAPFQRPLIYQLELTEEGVFVLWLRLAEP